MKKLVKNVDENIDILTQIYFTKEESSRLKTLIKVMVIPLVGIWIFSFVRLFYMEENWGAYFIVMRALLLVVSMLAIFLFSVESFEWRAISGTITTFFVLLDIIGQALDWYDVDTSTNNIQYDFLSHALAGFVLALIFTNVLRGKNKEVWIISLSAVGGFLWEGMEFIVNLVEIFILGDIDNFIYNTINSVWDILAHVTGTIIAVAIYVAYSFAKCPKESRQGLFCRI